MNLIQKLESDISQAAEYGGIPNHYTRSELRQILAALKVSDKIANHCELLELETTDKNVNKMHRLLKEWRKSINCN